MNPSGEGELPSSSPIEGPIHTFSLALIVLAKNHWRIHQYCSPVSVPLSTTIVEFAFVTREGTGQYVVMLARAAIQSGKSLFESTRMTKKVVVVMVKEQSRSFDSLPV